MKVKISDNEYWWFGNVNSGHDMPASKDSALSGSMFGGRENDQFTPVALSSAGRYVWSDGPFTYEVKNGEIIFEGDDSLELCEGYDNLRGAYLAAQKEHFKFLPKTPDLLFLKKPQYNTWIELGTEQTQEGILGYAEGIINSGMPAGILMIDGGWQEDYGVFEFNARKVPDPKAMTDKLHEMGFKVMLWVSPIVSSAGTQFKMLRDKGFLLKNKDGKVAVREWWSGYSAVLDFSNPSAVEWYHSQLDSLEERYGVDGFKFDAGDLYFYDDNDITYAPVTAREQTKLYNIVGERYPFNEFRAAWNCGGRPIVARLHDKHQSWDNFGLNTLIPHTILQGLCGYAYCCPDMVGGGMIGDFSKGGVADNELFIRWVQANALMGMMQISIAPWRVFDEKTFDIIKKFILIHNEVGEYCSYLAKEASRTGEPIVRHMAYNYPEQGFETVNDQFMLGDKYLSAPVIKKGQTKRTVKLPNGSRWISDRGEIFEGGQTVEEDAPLSRLIYYRREDA